MAVWDQVCCPKCKIDCNLPYGLASLECLATNDYVLDIIKLKNLLKDQQDKEYSFTTGVGSQQGTSSCYKFPAKGFSVERLSNWQPLKTRDRNGEQGHDEEVRSVEFSDDGSFFLTGSDRGRVLLWSMDRAIGRECDPKATAMNTRHGGNIFGLSISPDNNRIFSAADDGKLFVHDART